MRGMHEGRKEGRKRREKERTNCFSIRFDSIRFDSILFRFQRWHIPANRTNETKRNETNKAKAKPSQPGAESCWIVGVYRKKQTTIDSIRFVSALFLPRGSRLPLRAVSSLVLSRLVSSLCLLRLCFCFVFASASVILCASRRVVALVFSERTAAVAI